MRIIILSSFLLTFISGIFAQTTKRYSCLTSPTDSVDVTITDPSCFGVFDGELKVQMIPNPALIPAIVPSSTHSYVFSGTNNGFLFQSVKGLICTFQNLQPDDNALLNMQFKTTNPVQFRQCLVVGVQITSPPPFTSDSLIGPSKVCQNSKNVKYFIKSDSASVYNITIKSGDATIASRVGDTIFVNFGSVTSVFEINQTDYKGCPGNTSTSTVKIENTPSKPTISGKTLVCGNTLGEPYSISSTGGTYTWTVTGATKATDNGNNITVNFGSTNAKIKVFETSPLGCTGGADSINVTVDPLPVTLINGSTTVCENTKNEPYAVKTPKVGNTYSWSVANGTIASNLGSSIKVDFTNATPVTVTVTEKTANNCAGLPVSVNVKVITKPTPTISGKGAVCANSLGEIYTASGNSGSTFTWAVSGATIASTTATTSTLNFSTTNTTLKLVETPAGAATCKSDTVTKAITVNPKPATTLAGNSTVCENAKGEIFTATGLSGSTFIWKVTGATLVSSSSNFATVDFASTNATITVLENSSAGCKGDSVKFPVSVIKKPVPVISGSSAVCENTSNVVYTATGLGTSTFKWFVSNATLVSAVGNKATINVLSSDAVIKVVEIPSGSSTCKSDTVSFLIKVNANPITTIAGVSPVCENVKGQVYTASGTGSTYVWSISGATLVSSVGNKATLDFTTTNATLTVTETSSVGCKGTPVSKNIVVNKIPTTSISGKSQVCENTKGEIYTAALNVGSSYVWSVSGATLKSSSGNTTTIDFASTNATVSVIETNAAGCPGVQNNFSVTLTKKPIPTLAGKTPLCEGTKGEVYTATGTAGSTFNWFAKNATIASSTGNTANVDFGSTNATIKVVEISSGAIACSSDTVSKVVTVIKAPVTTISGLDPVCENTNGVVYTASNTVGSTYVWTVTGATLASSAGNVATLNFASTNASLSVVETNSTGCIGTKVTKAITVNKIPTTSISGKSQVCENTKGEIYTAALHAGSSYVWSVSGATLKSSSGNTATIDFGSTNATVSVIETNAAGCPGVKNNFSVSISKKPIPNLNGKSPVCENTKGEVYTAPSSATSTYQWFATNATIVSQNKNKVTVNFNTANAVIKVVEITNGSISCIGDTVSKSVVVNKRPVTTLTGVSPLCANTKGQIYTASGIGSTYQWFVKNATIVGTPAKTATIDFGTVNATLKVVETSSVGCSGDTAIKTVVIQNLPLPTISGVSSICAQTKSVAYTVSGGSGSSYTWFVSGATIAKDNGSSINVDFANTNAIVKVIEVGTTCKSDTVFFPVTVNALPVLTTNGNKIICKGDTTTLVAKGANSYSWSPMFGLFDPFSGTTIAKPPITTAYTVTGINTKGCKSTATINVTVNAIPVASVSPLNPSICNGNSVQLVASGGTKYSWSPTTGLSNATIANPIANPTSTTTYTVTVDNGATCKATATTTVTVNPLPTLKISKDTTICLKQQAQLSTTFDPTYTYKWTPATGLSSTTISNPIAKPSITSTYKVVVTSASGCKDSASVKVSINSLPTASVTISPNDTICRGTVVTLTASGGNSYQWFPAAAVTNPTSAVTQTSPKFDTNYKVAVMGANGCADTARATIIIEPVITISTNIGDTICQGDTTTITASATNGVKFTWSPTIGLLNPNTPSTKAFPLTTTKYTVTVENSIGCINTDSVIVEVLNAAPLTVTKDTTICKGDSKQLMATTGMPNFSYKWTPSTGLNNANIQNPVASSTSTITYNVTATHATAVGCPSFGQVKISVNPVPTVNVSKDTALCAGDSVVLTATGGTNYTWSPSQGLSSNKGSSVKASPSSTTVYTIVGSNGVGCSSKDSVKVTVNSLPLISVSGTSNICPGESTQLTTTPSNLVSYSWTPTTSLSSSIISNPKATPLTNTTYKVVATDANNCKGSSTFSISVKAKPTLKVSSDTTICKTDTISLRAISNATQINWTPSSDISNVTSFNPKVWPATTQAYKAVVTSALGCKDSATVKITVNKIPTGTITVAKDVLCFGDATTLTLALGSGFTSNPLGSFSFNGKTFTNTSTFPYSSAKAGDSTITVYFRDLAGCVSNTNVKNILTLQPVKFDTLILAQPSCTVAEGKVRVFNITGGLAPYSIDMNGTSFATSDKTFDNLGVGSYTFKVTDANLCSASKSTIFTGPISFDTLITRPVCFGDKNGTITIANTKGGIKPYQFSYGNNTSFASDTLFKNLGAANHTIFIKDASGCELSVSVPMSTPDSISIIELAKTNILCKNELGSITVNTKGGSGILTATLNSKSLSGPGNLTFDQLSKGSYTINVVDAKKCANSYDFSISEEQLLKSTFKVLSKSTCFDPTGSAKIESTIGGSGKYQYAFDGQGLFKDSSTFAKEIASLSSGIYKVVTRDIDFGCTDTASFTIERIGGVDLDKIVVKTTPSCTDKDGIISLTNIGGEAPRPYLFELRNALTDAVVSTQQLDSSFIGLSANNYKVVIYDSILCKEELPVTLAFLSGLNIKVTKTDESCNLNNGQIALQISGGTTPYLTSLNNELSYKNQSIYSSLNEGAYTVYVKDSGVKGCKDSVNVSLSNVIVKPTGKLTSTESLLCFGSSTVVTAKLDSQFVAHPSGSYSYDLGKTFTNLNSMIFNAKTAQDTIITLVLRDQKACSNSDTMSLKITVLPEIKFDASILAQPTCTIAEGKIRVFNITGGLSPYSIGMNGASFATSDKTFDKLGLGSYVFKVTDANSCTATKTVNFTGPITFDTLITKPICFGDKNGSITIKNTKGGVKPYQFSYATNTAYTSDSIFNNLGAAIHTIFIKDASGCELSVTIPLSTPDSISIIETAKANILCKDELGSITVNTKGGTGILNLTLGSTSLVGPGDVTFDNLTAGTYTINAVDAKSCSNSFDFTITSEKILKSTFKALTQSTCFDPTGSAKIESTVGGSGNYEYSFVGKGVFKDSLAFATALNTLTSGIYTVVTRDVDLGCTDTSSFTISRIGGIDLDKILVKTSPSCSNTDGIISLTNIGGSAPRPYTFELRNTLTDAIISPEQSDSTFKGLGADNYKVVIYDAIKCPEELPVTLPTSPGLNIVVSKINESCNLNNGQISLQITGGTAPYLTSLNDELSFKNQTSYTNLNEGLYPIYVKDSGTKGCKDSVNVRLTNSVVKPTGTLSSSDDTLCFGTIATVTAKLDSQFVAHPNGSYSFDLGKTFTIVNTLFVNAKTTQDTVVTVVFRDATACSNSDTLKLKLKILAPVTFSTDTIVEPTCTVPGELRIHNYAGGVSPYTFSVNSNPFAQAKDTVIKNMTPGIYEVVVKDDFKCQATKLVDFTGVLNYDLAIKTPTCYGDKDGEIKISNVSGGKAPYVFSLNDPINNFTPTSEWLALASAKYMAYIKDADGCLVSVLANLTQPDSIVVTELARKDIGCIDTVGQLAVSIVGGTEPIFLRFKTQLLAGQPSYTFDNLKAGKDTLYILDANSCGVVYPFEIAQSPNINTFISQSKLGECNKEVGEAKIDSTINGSGLYSYRYISATTFVDELTMESNMIDLSVGSYTVVTKDEVFECMDTTIFTISRKNGVDSLDVTKLTSCNDKDGSLEITKVWGAAPKPFTFELLNAVNDSILVAKNSDSLFDRLSQGLYTIAVYDSLNCRESFIYEIGSPEILSFAYAVGTDSCGDTTGSIRVILPTGGKNPYSYSINGGELGSSNLFENLTFGLYDIQVTDASNPVCNASTTVYVPTNMASVENDTIKNITCYTGEDASYKVLSLFNADSNYTYTFSLLDEKYTTFTSDSVFTGLKDGLHTLYIKQTKKSNPLSACIYKDFNTFYDYTYLGTKYDTIVLPFFEVQKGDSLGATFEVKPSKYETPTGQIIVTSIFGGTAPFQVKKDEESFINYVSPLVYDKLAQNEVDGGAPYVITIVDSNACINTFKVNIPADFYVPNIITPNGDGKNDTFHILGLPSGSRLKVFDRWGVLSYENYNYSNDWDGGSSPDGTYFYNIKLSDGSVHTGWIQIVK